MFGQVVCLRSTMWVLREPLLDHRVYATPDLEATCRVLDIGLGVRASADGQVFLATKRGTKSSK